MMMFGLRRLPTTMLIKLRWSWLLRSPTEGEPRPMIHAQRPAPTAILFHRQRLLQNIRRLNGIVWADTLPYIGESWWSGLGGRFRRRPGALECLEATGPAGLQQGWPGLHHTHQFDHLVLLLPRSLKQIYANELCPLSKGLSCISLVKWRSASLPTILI